MRRVKSTHTAPERALRRALWRLGLRYRIAPDNVPGRPDLTFFSRLVAVFVDGGFWHGKKLSPSRLAEMSNYWRAKIARNVARDEEVNDELIRRNWTVLRIDASAAEREPEAIAKFILRILRSQPIVDVPVGVTVMRPRRFGENRSPCAVRAN
ncbi:MAG: DNA mismatch endonuclease Vsr [Chloroflexi bacterium]|nr:DNA mismatch endonuclease Vsr [Chloroflexota bacterium]